MKYLIPIIMCLVTACSSEHAYTSDPATNMKFYADKFYNTDYSNYEVAFLYSSKLEQFAELLIFDDKKVRYIRFLPSIDEQILKILEEDPYMSYSNVIEKLEVIEEHSTYLEKDLIFLKQEMISNLALDESIDKNLSKGRINTWLNMDKEGQSFIKISSSKNNSYLIKIFESSVKKYNFEKLR